MSGRHAYLSLVVLSCVLISACDPPAAAVDAAVPADAVTLPMSRLLGGCYEDWQCPGPGAYCRTNEEGYPGGQCTVPCTDRTPCDDGAVYNECLLLNGATTMSCETFCRNGSDCRTGYTCEVLGTDAAGSQRGFCIPVCASDEECGGTAQCDPYTKRCVAHGMVATSGALTGEACVGNGACRSGTCRTSTENGQITGFLNGYCQSLCRIPAGYNTNNYFDGNALPQSDCAGDAVCVPGAGEYGAGDLGVCMGQCTSNADCRAGYHCRQTFGTHTFTNGYCEPIDCTEAGMTCPSGTCHQGQDAQGNVFGLCG